VGISRVNAVGARWRTLSPRTRGDRLVRREAVPGVISRELAGLLAHGGDGIDQVKDDHVVPGGVRHGVMRTESREPMSGWSRAKSASPFCETIPGVDFSCNSGCS